MIESLFKHSMFLKEIRQSPANKGSAVSLWVDKFCFLRKK